jgi:aconitate hydratase
MSQSPYLKTLTVNSKPYQFYCLQSLAEQGHNISRLPNTLKILLENIMRHQDGQRITPNHITQFINGTLPELPYRPARVLMQDFTGVPAVVDLAAMRDAVKRQGGDPLSINPTIPVDLVIDHSLMVDVSSHAEAFEHNVAKEFERNQERYAFLKWGAQTFQNFRVVPPGTGICHQVNLEYLAQTVWCQSQDNGPDLLYPDTVVGTDSHTTMVNALSVLGWGVGGIEAEAALLGQPISLAVPPVVGVELTGRLPVGTTATDLVLTITHKLRKKGVVGSFVEFFGDGLSGLSLADRGTISNMAPEYGATCGFFPTDQEVLDYLALTGRDTHHIDRVEAYAKHQGLWANNQPRAFTDTLTIDLSHVAVSLAGPNRPQDQLSLTQAAAHFPATISQNPRHDKTPVVDGDVVIAAITSCTNTSNPAAMIGAGLLAKKAVEKGLTLKPWVKASFAPGSQVVTDYLAKAGLQTYLDQLGFHLVGYGCTTCIGNSGPLDASIEQDIQDNNRTVCAILSGNRNFEGRIHPLVKNSYLASPLLVVAYALTGSIQVDLSKQPVGTDASGNSVYLKDIWPQEADIQAAISQTIAPALFKERYGDVFKGEDKWQSIGSASNAALYDWPVDSTYIQNPPYFDDLSPPKESGFLSGIISKITNNKPASDLDIANSHILALLGDSVTTDHISPAGSIAPHTPAGQYLQSLSVQPENFNSYGSRRGNHQVMMRGTFANVRLQNKLTPDKRGGYTRLYPDNLELSIYDAAMTYKQRNIPLVVIAGKEYGTGSSRDWAAKGTQLLGVKAVIAQSFERIHRTNLVGMGVLPLEFMGSDTPQTLNLTGPETVSLSADIITPKGEVSATIHYPDGTNKAITLRARLDTQDDVTYYKAGGILPFVLMNG